jgi:predicted anti-sigma-YlaC factor YlaD
LLALAALVEEVAERTLLALVEGVVPLITVRVGWAAGLILLAVSTGECVSTYALSADVELIVPNIAVLVNHSVLRGWFGC